MNIAPHSPVFKKILAAIRNLLNKPAAQEQQGCLAAELEKLPDEFAKHYGELIHSQSQRPRK